MAIAVDTVYSVAIDETSELAWREALAGFGDANIYQTWAYESCCHPRSAVSRLTLRRGGEIVGLVQARVLLVPWLHRGIALVRWGPLWRPKNQPAEQAHLRQCLAALVQEYAVRRGLAVQVLPAPSADGTAAAIESALAEAGFRRNRRSATGRTIIVDLEKDLDQLQAGLHKKWRNCLSYARRTDQEVVDGDGDDLFLEFSAIYKRMRARKRFESYTSVDAFRALQKRLPPGEKMRVFVCRSGSCTNAGAVVSLLGDTGVWLFGASDGEGLEKKSSYLVQWRVIEWLKEQHARAYDLNGVNAVSNPGGYCFKSRLAGRNGQEINSLGRFVAAPGRGSAWLIGAASMCLGSARALRRGLRNALHGKRTTTVASSPS